MKIVINFKVKDMKIDNDNKKNGKLPIFGVISRLLCFLNIHKPVKMLKDYDKDGK